MGAFSHAAQAIKRWHAARRGKVPVGTASCQRLFQLYANFTREFLRRPEEPYDTCGAFHRRPVQSAADLDRAALVKRLQRAEFLLQRGRILETQHADID